MWDCWVLVTHRFYQYSCRCRRCQCRWRNQAQVGVRRGTWSLLCFFSWWSVVEPSWDDRGSSIWGCLLFFWFRSRTYVCTLIDVWFYYVLCEVAIVSQLCISVPYVLHGLCEDYLTCDIAFNAVMPLSHASTRGRYSRIVGVISWYQSHPRLRSPRLDRIADVVESRTKKFES